MVFKIVGNRPHILLEKMFDTVDKEVADTAFKKYQKESIDPFMKAQSFWKYKTNA